MTKDVPALRSLRLLSSTFRGEWRSRLRFDTGYEDLDRSLPKDATVLLHEEYLRLGINRRAIADSARWQGAIDYRQLRSPDRVNDMLTSLGVTDVVWSRSHSPNREIPISGELVFFDFAFHHAKDRRDAGAFATAAMPTLRPAPKEPGVVAYFGCKTVRTVPWTDIDGIVSADGDQGTAPDVDAGTLLASADFAVVDERCRAHVTPQLDTLFLQAPRWGDRTLWVRRGN